MYYICTATLGINHSVIERATTWKQENNSRLRCCNLQDKKNQKTFFHIFCKNHSDIQSSDILQGACEIVLISWQFLYLHLAHYCVLFK